MGNKYSELSNWEINHLIAESRNGRKIDKGVGRDIFVPKICTHYHDAMQLMINNKIALKPVLASDNWHAISNTIYINRDGSSIDTSSVHKNPCRAIAECYLLIKETENESNVRGDKNAK